MPIDRIITASIQDGAVVIADLAATGTPSSTTFLRGDNAWADSGAIGVGQTWTNVTASRAFSTTYTNTTGRPIMVAVTLGSNGTHFDAFLTIIINGNNMSYNGPSSGATALGSVFSSSYFIVPAGATYSATRGTYGATLSFWWELR